LSLDESFFVFPSHASVHDVEASWPADTIVLIVFADRLISSLSLFACGSTLHEAFCFALLQSALLQSAWSLEDLMMTNINPALRCCGNERETSFPTLCLMVHVNVT
jgi:hypothetical protein